MMQQAVHPRCRPSRAAASIQQQHQHLYRRAVATSARRRLRAAASAAATAAQSPAAAAEAKAPETTTQRLELRDPLTGASVHVFGVDHRHSQPDIAAWVLRARPAALVAETACTPQHGLAPATALDASSPEQLGAPGASAFFLRMFAQVAGRLRQQLLDGGMKYMSELGLSSGEAYERAVADALAEPGGLWAQASANFNGEQLAYVAGLCVGAPVLFGDRPKAATYRRLWHGLSIEDLDAAYEDERVREALEELRGMATEWERQQQPAKGPLPASVAAALRAGEAGIAPVRPDGGGVGGARAMNAFDRIMYLEREAVMCAVLSAACSDAQRARAEAARQRQEAAAAEAAAGVAGGAAGDDGADASPPLAVAAVFGAAHLPGLQRLWESGEWRALLAAPPSSPPSDSAAAAAALLASSPLLSAPPVDPASVLSPQAGLKRGLLEALLSRSVTEEVIADLDNHLPPIPPLLPSSPSEAAAAAGLSSPEEAVLAASLSAPHPAMAPRAWSREIYGTFRMRLAALPVEVLDGVASAWPGADAGALTGEDLPPEARSAWGLLAPLRALRPTFGGPGWSAAMGLQLRQLDYELGGPGEEEGDGAAASSEDSSKTAQQAFFQDV